MTPTDIESYESLDGEGNLLEFANYSWREDGQPLSMSSDNDGDGLLNWSEVYEYNEIVFLGLWGDGDEIYDLSITTITKMETSCLRIRLNLRIHL